MMAGTVYGAERVSRCKMEKDNSFPGCHTHRVVPVELPEKT